MYRRIKLFSIMSLALAVCVASIGTFSPSAIAMDVERPSYEAFKDNIIFQLLKAPADHYAIVQTVDRTYLEKSQSKHFGYQSDPRNIAINHFVKGGGVTYTHGSKAVTNS